MYVRLKIVYKLYILIFLMGGIDLKLNYNISLGNKRLIMVERSERKSRNKYVFFLIFFFREGFIRIYIKVRDIISLICVFYF